MRFSPTQARVVHFVRLTSNPVRSIQRNALNSCITGRSGAITFPNHCNCFETLNPDMRTIRAGRPVRVAPRGTSTLSRDALHRFPCFPTQPNSVQFSPAGCDTHAAAIRNRTLIRDGYFALMSRYTRRYLEVDMPTTHSNGAATRSRRLPVIHLCFIRLRSAGRLNNDDLHISTNTAGHRCHRIRRFHFHCSGRISKHIVLPTARL